MDSLVPRRAVVVAVLSLLPTAAAQLQGGGACVSDWDCSLGGVCNTGSSCECDVWFTGAQCDLLNVVAPSPEEYASWGLQLSGYSTWGGHAVLDTASGVWHGFFSLMCKHGPLDDWTTYSSIIRATAPAVTGPFAFAEQLDVPYATNAMYVPPAAAGGLHMVWRIGDAMGANPDTWSPCYDPPADGSEGSATSVARLVRAAAQDAGRSGSGGVETSVTFVQTSAALAGPWSEWGSVAVNLTGTWATGTSNPAPFIFPNGSTLLFHSAQTCPPSWGLAPSCIGVAVASSWEGPYTEATALPITHPEGEDPFVFRDPRGNFHL